jgi:hypothetical protein
MRLHFRLYTTGGLENGSKSHAVSYSTDGLTFHPLPEMPKAKASHCTTVLAGGNIFVAGDGKSCFLYEKETKLWRRCPNMTKRRGGGASCGVIKIGDDAREEAVVAGGFYAGFLDTVDIYSFEESRWRSGNK